MVEYREIHDTEDPDFEALIKVYNQGFLDQKEIYIDPVVFTWMLKNRREDTIPHLGVLKTDRVIGMASFSSTPTGAIGWYLTIIKEEQQKGYASLLLEKIKKAVLEDATNRHWKDYNLFIELEQDKAELWTHKGFTILPVRYYQPPMMGKGDWIPLLLGATPVNSEIITGTQILKIVSYLYFKIYNVSNYNKNDYFKNIKEDCEFLSMRLK